MKKIRDVFLTVFGVGITLCLFAGGLAFLGFVAALVIGGEIATEICVFIHKSYYPWVITFSSIFVGLGLVGMYLGKIKALTVSSKKNNDTTI